MKRLMHFFPVVALVALAVAGIAVVYGVNRNQVHTHDGQTCFTVNHSTTYVNSGRDAAGKVVFFTDKLRAGSKICRSNP